MEKRNEANFWCRRAVRKIRARDMARKSYKRNMGAYSDELFPILRLYVSRDSVRMVER